MKKIFNIALIVAAINLLLVWAAYGLLVASGFELFTFWSLFGLAPAPTHSPWQMFLLHLFGLLSGPTRWIAEPKGMLTIVLLSVSNSIIWGLCLGLPIYAITHRFGRHAA